VLYRADLQIGYTTVFFWEYFGPMMVYALIYFFPKIVYPTYKYAPSVSACLCLLYHTMQIVHLLKTFAGRHIL